MPSIQVKNVSDEVHAVLRSRAANAGQSMQEYLSSLLIEHAESPTVDEVLEHAAAQAEARRARPRSASKRRRMSAAEALALERAER